MTYSQPIDTRPLTAMQAFRKLPEGTLAEVINDELYVSPSPTTYHQKISIKLKVDLYVYVQRHGLGTMFDTPTDIHLAKSKSVLIPDIHFIANSNKKIKIERGGVYGAPDLIVEILSPGTRNRDLTIKKRLYEKAGVREYWIVDPETKETHGYLLKNGAYDSPLKLKSKVNIRILNKTFDF